jgi:hypothetical protein
LVTEDNIMTEEKQRTANTGLAKLAVEYIETLCFYVTFVLADNLVFQNPPLRQAWERYLIFYETATEKKYKTN